MLYCIACTCPVMADLVITSWKEIMDCQDIQTGLCSERHSKRGCLLKLTVCYKEWVLANCRTNTTAQCCITLMLWLQWQVHTFWLVHSSRLTLGEAKCCVVLHFGYDHLHFVTFVCLYGLQHSTSECTFLLQ